MMASAVTRPGCNVTRTICSPQSASTPTTPLTVKSSRFDRRFSVSANDLFDIKHETAGGYRGGGRRQHRRHYDRRKRKSARSHPLITTAPKSRRPR
jgi:hypothetical protein